MKKNDKSLLSNCHNIMVVIVCMASLLAYIFLNTQSWQNAFSPATYANKELSFGDNTQEFNKMPAQSIVSFIFEQTKEVFSQIISKRLK